MKEHPTLKGIFVNEEGEVYTTRKHSGGTPEAPKLLTGTTMVDGYVALSFSEGKRKYHRVVAETLIPNPQNLRCVNHIDCDKSNNHPANLEWCSHRYNTRFYYSQNPTEILDLHTGEVLSVPDVMKFCEDNDLNYSTLRASEYQDYAHKSRWKVLGRVSNI
jgi:hypothetical protein